MSVVIGIVIFFVIMFVFNPKDSTDKSWLSRSGLVLYTDYGTGLQYLKGGLFGNLTPRLDGNGKHMSIEDERNIKNKNKRR